MTEFNIEATALPAIKFNFDELKAWAKAITEQYNGLVVTEDDVVAIKSEMAGLNKIKKSLDDARKEAVRQVSGPIREFEGQIKEVMGLFGETYDFLGQQVKAHEEVLREQKRRNVEFLIADIKDEHGVKGLDIPVQEPWLNKTKTMKAIKAEVESLILAHQKAEREAAELAQAKMDRALAIENHASAMSSKHGVTIPAAQFLRLNDLGTPLSDALAQIERAFETRAATQAAAATTAKPAAQAPTPPVPPVAPAPKSLPPQAKTKEITITVEYSPNQEQAVFAVLRQLQALGTVKQHINSAVQE